MKTHTFACLGIAVAVMLAMAACSEDLASDPAESETGDITNDLTAPRIVFMQPRQPRVSLIESAPTAICDYSRMGRCQQGAYDDYLICIENICGTPPPPNVDCDWNACRYTCKADYNDDWAACAAANGCDSYAKNHACVADCQDDHAACLIGGLCDDVYLACVQTLGLCLKTCPLP